MKTKTQERGSGKDIDFNPEGFHIICGTGPKNGINGTIPGIKGCGKGRALDLTGLNNLLVVDVDYFIKHHEEIFEMAREKQYNRLKYLSNIEAAQSILEEKKK